VKVTQEASLRASGCAPCCWTPALGQATNAAAAKALAQAAAAGRSAAPGSIQHHTGDVHVHHHQLVTDGLQSGGEGEREISLSAPQSLSETPEHCCWNAVLAWEILGKDGTVICQLVQTVG